MSGFCTHSLHDCDRISTIIPLYIFGEKQIKLRQTLTGLWTRVWNALNEKEWSENKVTNHLRSLLQSNGNVTLTGIRVLQCILLKMALVVGVEIHAPVEYIELKPPGSNKGNTAETWKFSIWLGKMIVVTFFRTVFYGKIPYSIRLDSSTWACGPSSQ